MMEQTHRPAIVRLQAVYVYIACCTVPVHVIHKVVIFHRGVILMISL